MMRAVRKKIIGFCVAHPRCGYKLIKKYANLFEGGQKTSNVLREYLSLKNVNIDLYTYGSCFDLNFNNGGTVTIGRYCSIAANVRYFGANHPISNISTSAYWYNKSFGLDVVDVERSTLVIGNDVWIGYGVIITAGCKNIGNGAVIGAGSVVTKDVEPYSIVAGNPAKRIRKRFSDELIRDIEKTQWWLKTPEHLYEYYEYMDSPDEFIKYCD